MLFPAEGCRISRSVPVGVHRGVPEVCSGAGLSEVFPVLFPGEFQRCVLEPDYQKCSRFCSQWSSRDVFWSRISRSVPGGVHRGVPGVCSGAGLTQAFPVLFPREVQGCVLGPDSHKRSRCCSQGSSRGVFWSRITRSVPRGVPGVCSGAGLLETFPGVFPGAFPMRS